LGVTPENYKAHAGKGTLPQEAKQEKDSGELTSVKMSTRLVLFFPR
jgi:hypothetical protein